MPSPCGVNRRSDAINETCQKARDDRLRWGSGLALVVVSVFIYVWAGPINTWFVVVGIVVTIIGVVLLIYASMSRCTGTT